MKPIIQSLLDNDLYKFTMLQAFLYYEKNTEGKYSFRCRTENIDLSAYIPSILEQIDLLCKLKFSKDELEYLDTLPYIKPGFTDFLKKFRFKKKYIHVSKDKNNNIDISIKGPIIHISLFEIPILSIVNEVFFKNKIDKETAWKNGNNKLENKLRFLRNSEKPIKFTEFGTRRRFSFEWQENVVKKIIEADYPGFIGTSNVYFAKKYNLQPIGTMAHEWIMAHAGVSSMEKSTELALQRWADFYKSELGIALTDTYTTNYFLSEFGEKLAGMYNGLRHDSGDWKDWGYKVINNYKKLGIDPITKTLIFSDALDFEIVNKIYDEFHDKVNLIFGIGTNLTNDVGLKPIQIVIKMVESNGNPVIKVSDTPGKIICENDTYKYNVMAFLKNFNLRLKSERLSFS